MWPPPEGGVILEIQVEIAKWPNCALPCSNQKSAGHLLQLQVLATSPASRILIITAACALAPALCQPTCSLPLVVGLQVIKS